MSIQEFNKEAMRLAIEESQFNKVNNYQNGGPFGAAIVKDGKIIATAHNTVIESHDATAHAEINAIRYASQILNTHDLSNCSIYVSTEPCPMCLSAIIWSNIKDIYFANTRHNANAVGFRDEKIYNYLNGTNQSILNIQRVTSREALKVLEDFANNPNKKIY